MTDVDDSIQRWAETITTSWLERARRGDAEAWRRLDSAYRRLVRWWCLKAQLPSRDVDDVVQEVFASVLTGIDRFQQTERGSFRGWLWTITSRKIVDYWRERNTQPQIPGGGSLDHLLRSVEAESGRVEGRVDQATKIIFDAVVSFVRSEFSDTDWDAFWKVVGEGRVPAAVADELGISRNRVYLAKCRILRRIRQEFHATEP
ncbi:MAG: sigma-70 family RNA polymerase sigma factor [Pirellulaceae bacterium]|nr:sigma-70 family RNA polymerase sigma factor [Pirellulaceae bacterium]